MYDLCSDKLRHNVIAGDSDGSDGSSTAAHRVVLVPPHVSGTQATALLQAWCTRGGGPAGFVVVLSSDMAGVEGFDWSQFREMVRPHTLLCCCVIFVDVRHQSVLRTL